MIESWAHTHPWMTFILCMMGLFTINSFFVSIGGGYKKFPPQPRDEKDDDNKLLMD